MFFSNPGRQPLLLLRRLPHVVRAAVLRSAISSAGDMHSPTSASEIQSDPASPTVDSTPDETSLPAEQSDEQAGETEPESEPGSPPPLPLPDTSSVISHSPIASPVPSTAVSSASSPTNISSRKAVCTHMRLTRIYGPYKCHHCGRVPRLGWVYRCVQDFGEDLVGFNHRVDDDFASALAGRLQRESSVSAPPEQAVESMGHRDSHPDRDEPNVSLPTMKPWMQKLADESFYTPEQIDIIHRQRQRVLDCISASPATRPLTKMQLQDATISDPTTLIMNNNHIRRVRPTAVSPPLSLRSCTIAPYWQTPIYATTKPAAELQDPLLLPPPPAVVWSRPARSICTYQTCSGCRPGSRDRTWQCLDPLHISGQDGELQIPNPSTDNRLISHPQLIQSACYKIFHPHPIRQSAGIGAADYDDDDAFSYDDEDDYGSGYDSSEISPDISSGQSLEGTPTTAHFDENRGWDVAGQAASSWARPQPLRRASSMDPKLLRNSRDLGNIDMMTAFQGLGIQGAGNAGAESGCTGDGAGATGRPVVPDWSVRPGAQAAMGLRSDEPAVAANPLGRKPSEVVVVDGGRAVTEEAIAAGEPDVILQA